MVCRQGLDDAPRLFEAETEGQGATGTAIAEWGTRCVDTLEMGMAARNLLSDVESIQTTNYGQTMIDGLRRRMGLLIQLMPNIVQQCGLGDFGKRLAPAVKPTREVQKVISVGAQRAQRQLTDMLGIEKILDPGEGLALLVEEAIRASVGWGGGEMGQG